MEQLRDLKERTMAFALAVARLCGVLEESGVDQHPCGQVRRSAAGVAANYRAARKARSGREFIAKLGVAIEEADGSQFWLEYLDRTAPSSGTAMQALLTEARELTAILTASVKTRRRNLAVEQRRKRAMR